MSLFQDVLESVDGGVFINLRDGAGSNLTSTVVGGSQALDVNMVNSLTIGVVDDTAFTFGTSSFQPIGGVFASSISALADGDQGAVALTATRDMHVSLFSNAGVAVGDTNAHGLFVRPGDGTNAQAYSAAGEAFESIRQGGNVANVTASNELKVLDTSATSILALMKPTTGTLTQVALSTSSQTLLASNSSRKGWSAYNDSNKVIYIAADATASSSAYTVKMQPNGFYESMDSRVYTGALSVISVSGISGNAVITEYA